MANQVACRPVKNNVYSWIEQNRGNFDPPICTKPMHGSPTGQMKCVFVGGPNNRSDYHIEEGEELFYMVEGDMCLKVVERGVHRDVNIKEGEIFLLPRRIPHSPQRKAGTVGFIVERDRLSTELDGMRFFVVHDGVPVMDVLYEESFHCENLGPQLAACIQRFQASEQCRTGLPLPDTPPSPLLIDAERTLDEPFSLRQWLSNHDDELSGSGSGISIFGDGYTSKVTAFGKGSHKGKVETAEVWMWQLVGTGRVHAGDDALTLDEGDCLWLPAGLSYDLTLSDETSRVLQVYMEPPRL